LTYVVGSGTFRGNETGDVIMPTVTERELVLSWKLAQTRLSEIKEAELRFRKLIAQRFFPSPKLGTNTAHITNSADIKLVHSLNYKLDQSKLEVGFNSVAAIDKAAAGRLFKWKAELNEVEYRALSDEAKAAFDATGVLTITEATPQLKLIDPQCEIVS
jgi:hypothetical protein